MSKRKKFANMSDDERRDFVGKRLTQAEAIYDYWKNISRRLNRKSDFTPGEIELIDIQLEKEKP